MGEYKIREAETPGSLILSGALSIENSVRIKEALTNALERSEHIELTLEEDSRVDLSLLQLLCSVHQTATAKQKTFKVLGEKAGNFAQLVADSGYVRVCGCAWDKDRTCLWARGGKR